MRLQTLLLIGLIGPLAAAEPDRVSFNRDIRPIMSDTCFHCHGFDPNTREAGLRLDIREAAISPTEDGIVAIVPGDPEASEAIWRIFDDIDPMPPEKAHKPLTEEQKELFRRWVEQGAEYEDHWSYTPLEKPEPPEIRNPQSAIRNPIDAFIQRQLTEEGIEPSPAADPEMLLRRLSLDLTGLPPASHGIAPGTAYDEALETLLASPHFGERLAVWWLDIARFADTVGFHGDQNQRIFPYRDYVINAFNSNKPFDQFTREQLAGDLLPDPTPEQLVATGYNRLNMMTREGGAQPDEYLAKYGAERVRSVAAAWFGSTFGCAECHDHKFDPISSRDFYELKSFFADVKQWGVYADYGYTPNPELKGFNNDYPFPPEIEVESPYLKQRLHAKRAELEALVESWLARPGESAEDAAEPAADFATWLASARQRDTHWHRPTLELPAPATEDEGEDKTADKTDDEDKPAAPSIRDGRLVLEEGLKKPIHLHATPGTESIAALRLDLAPADDEFYHKEARGLQLEAWLAGPDDGKRRLDFHFADATEKLPRYQHGREVIGIVDGWRATRSDRESVGVWILKAPITPAPDERLVVKISGAPEGDLEIGLGSFATLDPLVLVGDAIPAALAAEQANPAQRRLLAEAWMLSTQPASDAARKARDLAAEIRECRDGLAHTLVTEAAAEPLETRILPRGNWQDTSGEVVLPATPSFLPGRLESTPEDRLTRLDLANWIVSDQNPITARAVTNRLWALFFGTGLSGVVDDLGSQGELPSHPELLDWLAAEFRESGWDVKHMIRLIVTSHSYRQSSNLRPELADRDPDNRLLASQNPRRLEAEFVRDNALAISGLLELEPIGGPSVKPYQPTGYYSQLQFPNRTYTAHSDERQWRRGLYTHWQRTFLHPMMANFDAPARDECAASRVISNTPQQALTLLNDPTFVEAARVLAERLIEETPAANDIERLARAYQLALHRDPKSRESESLLAFLDSQRRHYGANLDAARQLVATGLAPVPDDLDPAEHAAWTQVARALLNTHESITRY